MEQTFNNWRNIWIERDPLPAQVQQFLRMFIQLSLGIFLCEGLVQAFHPGTEWQGWITCLLLLPTTLGVLRAWQQEYYVVASNLTFGFLGLITLISALFFPVSKVFPFPTLIIGAIAYIVFLELEKYRTGSTWVRFFTLIFVLHLLRVYFPIVGSMKTAYTWSFQYFPLVKTLAYLALFGTFIIPFFRSKRKSQRQLEVAIKAQRQLYSQALKEQKELAEMRMQFIASASHQFRTPLTIIKTNTFLLKQHVLHDAPKAKLIQSIKRIEKENERLRLLIENIMLLGKHSDQGSNLSLQRINIVKMSTSLIKETIEPMCECQITINTTGPEQWVWSHPLLLEHVILNVISNAIKYSAGAPSPCVHIHFSREECQVIVQDFGIGISDEDQAKLFQPFYRGQNALDIPGTGLGLVLAQELMHKLHGSIQLNSKINHGTIVTLQLPKTTPL